MKVECWSSIDLCGAQINRLDCDGVVQNGAEDVVLTCGFVDISITPITSGGDEIVDPGGAQGQRCAVRSDPSTIDAYEITITLCSKTDAALMELLGIFDPVVDEATGDIVGYKAHPTDCGDPACHCVPDEDGCSNPGVSIILWHVAWLGDERHPTYPYAVEAFPKVVFDPGSITVTRNQEFNTYTITGRTDCNPMWGQGPGAIYPEAAGLDRDWAEWLTTQGPPQGCDCPCGYAAPGTALGN